ncbi:hypothetical protein VE04_08351 [Pseudogymnoascus sp. 24MN13]|nr:hypothetical protein VE04_08351 [Pseudogymnoascus sp. 24MN13]
MASMDYENENGTRGYEGSSLRAATAAPRRAPVSRTAVAVALPPQVATVRSILVAPRVDRRGPPPEDDGAVNPGSNLFVTGIHPRLSEAEVTRLFEKYGEVEKCQIMLDPHTKESRGFGFVKMVTADQADAAKEGLQGEVIEGRTLSIEKARRSRPRTPTPGKYFEDDPRGPPPGRWGDRYDDRRRGGFRDDPYSYRGSRGDDRGDRGYGRRDRDDGAPRGIDRYGGGRDDRYGGRDDRRGGGGGYSDRDGRGDRGERGGDRDGGRSSRDAAPPAAYGDPAPRGDPRRDLRR